MRAGKDSMTESERYFIDGFLTRAFRPGRALDRLNAIIGELRADGPKPRFSWVEKYAFSADLRPNVFSYDPVFLDILIENGIPALLKKVTGCDLQLAHLQLRHAFKGESYMDWHRDTHFYGGDIHGNIPPVHKVIFYPSEGETPGLRLKVCPGSHMRYFGSKLLDTWQARVRKGAEIRSSDSGFLLFNTAILHAAAAVREPKGAFRLIYSFCPEHQLDGFPDQADLHADWRERLARGPSQPAAIAIP